MLDKCLSLVQSRHLCKAGQCEQVPVTCSNYRKGGICIARTKRLWYRGATYHVMARGIRRSSIFLSPEDHIVFLKILDDIRKDMHVTIHSFCLMTNHFHLLISTEDFEIWKIMSYLLTHYAKYFNCRHNYSGHVFDSRYYSVLIENSHQFMVTSRYIHLNPVKAHIVSNPEDYAYSSYGFYAGKPYNDLRENGFCGIGELVCRQKLYSYLGSAYPACNTAVEYQKYVFTPDSQDEAEAKIQKVFRENDYGMPA